MYFKGVEITTWTFFQFTSKACKSDFLNTRECFAINQDHHDPENLIALGLAAPMKLLNFIV